MWDVPSYHERWGYTKLYWNTKTSKYSYLRIYQDVLEVATLSGWHMVQKPMVFPDVCPKKMPSGCHLRMDDLNWFHVVEKHKCPYIYTYDYIIYCLTTYLYTYAYIYIDRYTHTHCIYLSIYINMDIYTYTVNMTSSSWFILRRC